MADYFSRALAFQNDTDLEADLVQDRQPDPRRQPGPINQDALRGQQRQPQPRAPQPAVRPVQAVPQAPQVAEQPQPQAADPVGDWFTLMRKHQIPQGQHEVLSDYAIELDRTGRVGQPIPGMTPELDADIRGYTQRFKGFSAARSEPQPQARPPASAGQVPAQPMPQQTAPQAPPQAQPQVQPETDYFGRALGTARPAAPQPSPVDPNAEPDASSWIGRRVQDVRGKRDARYRGLPAMGPEIDRMQGVRPENDAAKLWSYGVGAEDDDLGLVYKDMLGSAFIRTEKDANGYPVIVYRDGNAEKKAYVNQPGMDFGDVSRGMVGALPFVATGGMVGAAAKGAPLVVRALSQAGGQAATSAAQDAAGVATGVSDLDLVQSGVKAAVTGGFGAAGELVGPAISPIIRRFSERRMFESSTGQLTPRGQQAAVAAGIDPSMLSREVAENFAKNFAKSGDAQAAHRAAVGKEFNIPRTSGELAGDTNQLLREQQMRGGTYGTEARNRMSQFDTDQREAIVNATRGEIEPGRPGVAGQIAPNRAGFTQEMSKADMGANIGANTRTAYDTAKAAEKAAWDNVPSIKATPEALAELEGVVAKRLAGVIIHEKTTPIALAMAQALDDFKAGITPAKGAKILPDNTIGDVGTMRKALGQMRGAAATPEDKRAASAVYNAFLDFEAIAAEKAGNFAAAADARTARLLTRDVHEIFDGKKGTPAARILGDILKNDRNDSAEGVVNALFAGPSAEIKNGALTALQLLKRGYDAHLPPEAAKAAWDDIRLAYWMRISNTKGNETSAPAALASGIRNAWGTQGSIMRALYTPEEIAAMRRLGMAMDDIRRKNPNTSWSAIGVGALARDGWNAMLATLGWNTALGQMAAKTVVKPFSGAYGSGAAAAATGGGRGARLPNAPAPSLGGYGGAIGAEYER